MSSLREKQEYYRYGPPGGWAYKEPPVLEASVEEALKRENSLRRYRIIWGGVAIYRTAEDQQSGDVKGDRRATRVNNFSGRVQPAYMFARDREETERWFCYTDDLGRKVRTRRAEFIPPGRLMFVESDYLYVEYGLLNWFIEYEHEGEWHCIKRLETPEGLYYEPDLRVISFLRKREYENRNESPADIKRHDAGILTRILKERAARETQLQQARAGEMSAEVLRRAERQTVYPINL